MSNSESDDEHLGNIDPGAGCVEIWERLSEHRAELNDPPENLHETTD